MIQLEELFSNLKNWFLSNKRAIFWILTVGLAIYVCLLVREVTLSLLLSYGIAILIEPLVSKLERIKIRRALGVIIVAGGIAILIAILILVIVPTLIEEYTEVIIRLPESLESLASRLNAQFGRFGIAPKQSTVQWATSNVASINAAQIQDVLYALLSALLKGYSLTLTLVNLLLLPLFIFFISSDLPKIHKFIREALPLDLRDKVTATCSEILAVVYSFFKGQLTVSFILGLLYGIGLSLLDVPSGFAVGILAGVLNIVPYLGLVCGLVLATLLTVAQTPTFLELLSVWMVFVVVQVLDGTIFTPRIVGKSVGIHPLGVILALIIGGQLLGMAGLVLAIPGAAALRVLFTRLRAEVDAGVA